MGIDGEAGFVQRLLAFPKAFQRIVNLGFKTLKVLQGHIEEIAGATRRVKNLDRAEPVAEICKDGNGVRGFPGALQGERSSLHVGPILAERLDDGGNHEALDICSRRIVRAKGVSLALIESPLQQSAED